MRETAKATICHGQNATPRRVSSGNRQKAGDFERCLPHAAGWPPNCNVPGRGTSPHRSEPFKMLTLLLILLLVALVGGGLGHSRFGYAGWSPAGLLLVVVLVLFLTGTRL
jgi:hypothetical protein